MVNFLFWNLNTKNLQVLSASLVHTYDVDVLCWQNLSAPVHLF